MNSILYKVTTRRNKNSNPYAAIAALGVFVVVGVVYLIINRCSKKKIAIANAPPETSNTSVSNEIPAEVTQVNQYNYCGEAAGAGGGKPPGGSNANPFQSPSSNAYYLQQPPPPPAGTSTNYQYTGQSAATGYPATGYSTTTNANSAYNGYSPSPYGAMTPHAYNLVTAGGAYGAYNNNTNGTAPPPTVQPL